MADAIDEGYDIVCGWRKDRKDTFVTRRVPSVLANKLISWATGVELHDYGCSLKVFRAEVVKPLRLYGEMHRFLPAIASQIGVRIKEVVVNHRAAHRRDVEVRPVAHRSRRSRSGDGQVPPELLDAAAADLRAAWGSPPAGRGHADHRLSRLRAAHRRTQGIGDRPLLLLGMLLLFIGVQLVTFGLLAELLARTYYESQNKPVYVIREIRQTPELAHAEP